MNRICVLKHTGYYQQKNNFYRNLIIMSDAEVYSLCEAVADIAYIACEEQYETHDSREKYAQFIEWAKDFEYMHKHIEWGVNSPLEYIDSIYHFTIFKINQWRNV